jgi:hypothetical protein
VLELQEGSKLGCAHSFGRAQSAASLSDVPRNVRVNLAGCPGLCCFESAVAECSRVMCTADVGRLPFAEPDSCHWHVWVFVVLVQGAGIGDVFVSTGKMHHDRRIPLPGFDKQVGQCCLRWVQ